MGYDDGQVLEGLFATIRAIVNKSDESCGNLTGASCGTFRLLLNGNRCVFYGSHRQESPITGDLYRFHEGRLECRNYLNGKPASAWFNPLGDGRLTVHGAIGQLINWERL